MQKHFQSQRENSKELIVSSRRLFAQPLEDNKGLVIENGGNLYSPTNWAFGQLAQLAEAPAGFLRSLPSPIAADCINYGLQYKRKIEDIGVLSYKNGGPAELRAATGPRYGRIWNGDIVDALVNRFGDGVSGQFKVPGEFGEDVPITKRNTTLYAGDRDMFVFLADEKNRIEVPNRRNGQPGSLARGFFTWNSEVGSSTLGIATFLFDYTCSNRIVWGAKEYAELTIRHTASAPDKFIEEVTPALIRYAESSTDSITKAVVAARAARIDDVDEFLAKRFGKRVVSSIKDAHQKDEGRPIETLWDAATGITAYAREIEHQDRRVDFEREAGKVLDLAA